MSGVLLRKHDIILIKLGTTTERNASFIIGVAETYVQTFGCLSNSQYKTLSSLVIVLRPFLR
jgi:hypothetical protein